MVSKYAKWILAKADIHGQLCLQVPHYSEFFAAGDTALMLNTIIDKFSALDKIDKLSQRIVGSNPMKVAIDLLDSTGKIMEEALSHLHLRFGSENECTFLDKAKR